MPSRRSDAAASGAALAMLSGSEDARNSVQIPNGSLNRMVSDKAISTRLSTRKEKEADERDWPRFCPEYH